MSPLLKPSCARVLVPLLTLGFPLGVVLVVVLRLPVEEIGVASTDMRLLQSFSTFWCGWQEVTSTHPFYAYKVPKEPEVLYTDTHVNTFAFRFTLQKGHLHLLRYHLLPGSVIEASGCGSEGPVSLDIVYGEDDFENCWKKDDDDSDESDKDSNSSSSEENSKGTKLMPGLARSSASKSCPVSLSSSNLDVVADSSEQNSPTCQSKFDPIKKVNGTRGGLYFIVVRSDYALVNSLLLYVRLNRTSYELPDNMILCRSQSTCEIPLTFGSMEQVVVFMSAEPDAGSVVFPVRSKCKPRVVFYLVVFLMLPMMFAIALALAIRTSRRMRLASERSRVSTSMSPCSVATVPLLNGNVDAMKPSQTQEELLMLSNTPPPYLFVNELPPSYEAAVALASVVTPASAPLPSVHTSNLHNNS